MIKIDREKIKFEGTAEELAVELVALILCFQHDRQLNAVLKKIEKVLKKKTEAESESDDTQNFMA